MSKLRFLTIATVVFALSACGDDANDPTGVNSGDQLSAAEIQQVFAALFSALDAIEFDPSATAAPARVSVSQTFEATAPCGGGGTISLNGGVNGTVDDVTGEFDFSFMLTLLPAACNVPTESGTVTLDGAPNLVLTLDYAGSSDDVFTADGTYTGGLAFSASDGRSGSCAFDVTYSADVDLTTSSVTQSTSGMVCGVSANEFTVIQL